MTNQKEDSVCMDTVHSIPRRGSQTSVRTSRARLFHLAAVNGGQRVCNVRIHEWIWINRRIRAASCETCAGEADRVSE